MSASRPVFDDLRDALERPHRLGTIGGDLEEQLAHCASFSSILGEVMAGGVPQRGVDLGTGGGLPGVVLAALWPKTEWLLVDLREARAREVERVVLSLGFQDRVTVVASDAQTLAHDETFREAADVVVARAFGPASLTAECAAGLVKMGGSFIVSEPPEAEAGRWPEDGLRSLGFAVPRHMTHDARAFAAFLKTDACPTKFPRLPPRANRSWPGSPPFR